jgi:hypothetical protein
MQFRQSLSLSLSLLEAGVLFVDHIKSALPTNNLAVGASFFNGCSYFHIICLAPERQPFGIIYNGK